MADILKEIINKVSEEKISEACFEGANIILYTKNKDFFLNGKEVIKEVVNEFKKRVELRPDPSLLLEQEDAEKIIKEIIPEEAGLDKIIFDQQRSQVIIETEKPGLAIGKQGSLLKEIREKTMWVPLIKRKPAIRSQLIENIRGVLYLNNDYRKKFLNQTGHRIYDGWKRGKQHEWVRVSFLGAGRQVGRSCILLQTPESRILLDCGLDPAREMTDTEAFPFLDAPEFKISDLDAVIVSHAHLDHCGMIPYLFKFGYKGPIYCTLPTRDIMALMQLDIVKIAKNEGKEPLYTSDEIKEMVKHTICLEYGEVTDISPDIRITFYNSGHILGGAMIHIHVGNGLHNLLYTGDIKYCRTNLLEAAVTKFPRLESMILEATYGGKDNIMPPRVEQEKYLKEIIINTLKRKGKVLMPVLGSGRAQEVMVMIESMVSNKEIDPINVYVDGMVWDISAIHTAYPEFLNSGIRKRIFHQNENPFLSPIFKRVGSKKERMQVIEEESPCVILATSGMLVGGPSVEYLKHLSDNPRNSLVFSCYQGEGSLGRRILNGEEEIILSYKQDGSPDILKVNLEVHKIEITNHSDRRELMNFVNRCNPRPRKIIINHGEYRRCLDLGSSLNRIKGVEAVSPKNLESIRLK